MSAFEDARSGKLNKKKLDDYIKENPTILNEKEPKSGRTLLAIAAAGGFPEEIEALLGRGAKADGLSRAGETPLLLASWKATSERSRIIQLLLTKTPPSSIDITCPIAELKTPLMYAIENRDIDSIKMLRRAGAALNIKNADGFNAKEMAADTNDKSIILALDPEKEQSILSKLAAIIVSVSLYIVAWVNAAFNGIVRRASGLNPELDPIIDPVVNNTRPATAAEFLKNIDNFVTENPTLERFFKDNKSFLREMAQKAVDLNGDPNFDSCNGKLLPKTIKVSLHQQVIYCDDSSSMHHDDRWDNQKKLVQRIAKITTRILPEGEGVALRFINQEVDNSSNLSLEGIKDIMEPMSWKPNGDTEIGTYLRSKILEPLVFSKIQTKSLKRPLLISIITDGVPSSEKKSALVDAISECGRKLEEADYPRESVKFMIGQIGVSKGATRFLESLRENTDIAPVVFVTSDKLDERLKKFHDNDRDLDRWLIETLFSPLKEAES